MKNHLGERFGNYRLISLLGGGGFAEVYLGEHIYIKTHTAIKIFYAPITDEDTSDFLKEARTIAALDHPHIIPVFDCGVERHTPFLIMKYASGGTLRQRHPKGSRLPPKTIVSYMKQVADALQYAHRQKIIHRDVKPENMLLGHNDVLYLSDFGIALVAQTTQTTQDVIGTWAYMAPEQFAGKPRIASDQYSLGIAVYEWICGERPFQGTGPEIYGQHVNISPPSLKEKVSELPDPVEQVVFKALEKDPKKRFESIQAFSSALEDAYQPLLNNLQSFVGPTFPTQFKARELTSILPSLDQEVPPSRRNPDVVQPPQLSAIAPQPEHSLVPPLPSLDQEVPPFRRNPDVAQPPQLSAIAPQPEHSSLQKSTSIQSQSLSASDRSLSPKEEEALTIKFAIGKLNDYLLWFLWVLEITLMLRFILKSIGADPNNLFAGFLYALTDILTFPFLGIVKSPSINPPNQAFEFSALIAMATYFLILFAARRLLRALIGVPEEPPS